MRAASEPLEDAAWQASLAALDGPAALLRVSDELRTPVVLGVWRPAIVVPREMVGLAATGRRSLLAHELAHVAGQTRCCWPRGPSRGRSTGCPLAWTALRRLRARAEDAADDAVLHAGVPSSSYAAQLVSGGAGAARASGARRGRRAAGAGRGGARHRQGARAGPRAALGAAQAGPRGADAGVAGDGLRGPPGRAGDIRRALSERLVAGSSV
jgi:hypothetical protein